MWIVWPVCEEFDQFIDSVVTRAPAGTLCIRTLIEHSGRVFRLQFDEFQIVSSRFVLTLTFQSVMLSLIFQPRRYHSDLGFSQPLSTWEVTGQILFVESFCELSVRWSSVIEDSNDLIVATRCSSNAAGDRTYTYVSNFWERVFGLRSTFGIFWHHPIKWPILKINFSEVIYGWW